MKDFVCFPQRKYTDCGSRVYDEITSADWFYEAFNNSPATESGMLRLRPDGEEEILALPNTKFLGWLSGDALKVAYASSDVFLFPSAVETFGNVTLEAAASGLPLVVEAGCSGHLVNHGVNGFACSGADKQGWLIDRKSVV